MNRKERRRALATSRQAPMLGVDEAVARDFREAVLHLKGGRLTDSEIAHRRVLAKVPRHAPSLHHLGLIAFKRNARSEAVDYIRQSLAIDPRSHHAWLNLAVILGELRNTREAIDACRQCLALQPENSEPYVVLGNLLRLAENHAEAIAAYSRALQLKAEQPVALARLGDLLLQAGNIAEARAHCRRALEIDPLCEEARSLERRILASTGSVEQIEASLKARVRSPAELARSLDELGTFLRGERRYEEAVVAYQRAILADPGRADTMFNLALAYEGLGQAENALASYQAGLQIEPDRAEAYANVGCLLRAMDMPTGAIQALEHAIALDPKLAVAHYNLAVTLKQRERFGEALEAFRKCVACAPGSVVNLFELVNMRRVLCDWDGLDEQERLCLDLFRKKDAAIAPFLLISSSSSRADQLEAARRYIKACEVPAAMQFKHDRSIGGDRRRIRLGFLSCDFFEHATMMLLIEVLENLDRDRFELFGYCFSPDDGSALRVRTIGAFEHFTSICGLSNRQAADAILADGIDILIDLKGYTKDARPEILAYRPAPIQVNYLGYPATMGAAFIDYILADAIVAPMAHQEHYTERIVHLPHCYQPNDRQRKISDESLTRVEFGLPEHGFVFCSFNNSYKLNAKMFDIWMRLLRTVPESVLWVLVPSDICQENLRREAASRGVDPQRIVFAKRQPAARHLARHRLADLFLDVIPCNAHTTASDALWAGLPVLTCVGETFAGRVAASLLTAMNLPDLVTTSLEAYEQMALTLALDQGKLNQIRNKLARERNTSPLFDSVRYTRNLERSFEMMVKIWRSGGAPRAFAVVENDEG
jgi:predicted O-linked N-acetylglucosamine transferase (SPINDLY family)